MSVSNPVTMSMPDDDYARRSGDTNVPVPDPTRLTTQLVDRALASFREVVETRIGAMDQATKLVAADVARISAGTESQTEHLRHDIDRQLAALREYLIEHINRVSDISSEKFVGIDTRFGERDERTAQAAQESRISLDAALAAAKEAVSEQNKANTLAIGKSEAATQKQIDSLVALMNTNNKSVEDKISDLKSRLDRGPIEQTVANKAERRLDIGQILLAVSVVIAAIALVVGLR